MVLSSPAITIHSEGSFLSKFLSSHGKRNSVNLLGKLLWCKQGTLNIVQLLWVVALNCLRRSAVVLVSMATRFSVVAMVFVTSFWFR